VSQASYRPGDCSWSKLTQKWSFAGSAD